ncbi:hypothetical protein CRU99_08900 [Malaciobacter mytili]|uniref:SnoaL-like polyketide cyclase n=2 Tax=Malaciobacter mytili TaxID=603050 RepID=A0AAX2AJM4_9BACT|nr:ester cyclase [Malaciobacter mytili]AXH13761.1 SnoaL-like polyketide cyclase [Malaciobacter mytili LMG 24559]RXI42629.1 hypothetical protein CRU99_08900 [Malaciobacter mytili]RXK16369.1 hypothetical protein CP985_04225 [Malaciobacter mytili LMG 24559]
MKTKTNKELVKLYYDELWNKQNKEYIDILFDDNITFHGSLDIQTTGKKEFEEYMDKILEGIPNLYHGVELMVNEGNVVAVRAVYNGTHKGKIFEYEATNKRIKYNGASFFKFDNGKIVDIWVLGDLANLLKQLK